MTSTLLLSSFASGFGIGLCVGCLLGVALVMGAARLAFKLFSLYLEHW